MAGRLISLRAGIALAAAPLALLASCGGEDPFDETGGAGDGVSVVVSGQNWTEMLVMEQMYAALLEDAGYDVDVRPADTRDVYAPELMSGRVHVVPEYLSSMTEYLNRDISGPDAEPVASPDPEKTLVELVRLGAERGVTPLQPAAAQDANAFAVTEEFARQNDVRTLSALGALDRPITLAAASDCPQRQDCKLGLESVYGVEIRHVEPLGFGTPQAKDAVSSGEVDVALVGSSDGSLRSYGLVVLEDDQNWQNAENLVPVVNSEFLQAHPDIADVLDPLSEVLTTEDLVELNRKVDSERLLPEDVARDYLVEKGLL